MANLDKMRERIKETIKHSGISQTQIEKMLLVSPSCIAHYVKGDILPSIDKLADLCLILEVNPSYLLGLED